MSYGVIYKITNNINGKVYIGQTTKKLYERIKEHIYNSKRNSQYAIHKAIRKYGENNFNWEIIDTATNRDELNDKEVYWIGKYKSNSHLGYNMTDGGDGISGYKMSNEAKKKMSKSKIGKYSSGNHPRAKSVIQLSTSGEFIGEFATSKDASNEFGGDFSGISKCCKGEINSMYGFIWIYKDDYNENNVSKRVEMYRNNGAKRSVCKFDKDGKYIETFNSLTEASLSVGGNPSAILRCCKGKQKTHKGFIWKFEI